MLLIWSYSLYKKYSLCNSFIMYFAHTPAGKCFPYNLVNSLGITWVLSASWEVVSLQLAKVSQNGHFPWAGNRSFVV